MDDLPRCASCSSLLTPGAPFCMTCWTPVPEKAETEQVPDTVPAEWSATPAVAPVGGPPPGPASADPFAPPPAAPAGWRPPAVPGSMPVAPTSGGRSISMTTAGILLALVGLVVAGGWYGMKAITKDDSRAQAARVFREGNGGMFGDLMVGGSREAALSASPEERAMAAAWLPVVEPAIQEFNAAIGKMQATLDAWAGGDIESGPAAQATKRFRTAADTFVSSFGRVPPPPFLAEDAGNLVKAAVDYQLASDGLLSLIDGRKGIKRMSFGLSAGTANVAWDTGIETLYGAAGRPPAYRPNRTR